MISWDFLLNACPGHVFKNWISHLLFALRIIPVLPLANIIRYWPLKVLTTEGIDHCPGFLAKMIPVRFDQEVLARDWKKGGRQKSEYFHPFSLIKNQCLHEVASSAVCFLCDSSFQRKSLNSWSLLIPVSPSCVTLTSLLILTPFIFHFKNISSFVEI